jgi:hypothetical protein
MAIDNSSTVVLREACDYMAGAEKSESLEELHGYGDRLKNTLEAIDRTALDPDTRHVIENAIRHAVNAQRAVSPEGGRHDVREAHKLIAGLI